MADKKRRKGRKVFLVLFLICASFLLTFFIYHYIQFNRKVEIFNNKIQIGMNEEDVMRLLGSPSYVLHGVIEEELAKELKLDKSEFDKFVYKGHYAGRYDLILYFDVKANTLIYKARGITWIDF